MAKRLKLNFSKTKFSILSKNYSIPATTKIRTDSFSIMRTRSFKLLGVYIVTVYLGILIFRMYARISVGPLLLYGN